MAEKKKKKPSSARDLHVQCFPNELTNGFDGGGLCSFNGLAPSISFCISEFHELFHRKVTSSSPSYLFDEYAKQENALLVGMLFAGS